MKTIIQYCLTLVALSVVLSLFPRNSEAFRDIPENNLGYPVLITSDTGGSASGFFLNDGKSVFVITARHVFYPPNGKRAFRQKISCLSYSKDPSDTTANHFSLDLVALANSGDFKMHGLEDVAIIRIASLDEEKLKFVQGVDIQSRSKQGIVSVAMKYVKTFDQVLVANEVFLFGYPVSLGLKKIPQLDYKKPLLRKGIIAGKNETLHTLILDVPSYGGNSGGPVLEVESDGPEKKFRIVGVAAEFVPSMVQGVPINSGYSVAVSMNPVLDLVSSFTD